MLKKPGLIMLILLMALTGTTGWAVAAPMEGNRSGPAVAPESIRHYVDKHAYIPGTAQPPVIDGSLSDPAWSTAAELNSFVTAYDNHPAEPGTVVKVTYDSSNLYAAIQAPGEEEPTLALVDLMIKPPGEEDAYYVVNVKNEALNLPYRTNWGPGAKAVPGTKVRQQTIDGIFTAELAIPLASLGIPSIQTEMPWGFNVVFLHKISTKPLSSWIQVRNSYYSDTGASAVTFVGNIADQGRFGRLSFSPMPPSDSLNKDPKSGQAWIPEQTEFKYLGYTDKEFSFKRKDIHVGKKTSVSLRWGTPSGAWSELEDVQIDQRGERWTIAFSHPEPKEEGLYRLELKVSQGAPDQDYSAFIVFDRKDLIDAGDRQYAALKERIESPKTPVAPAPPSEQVQSLLELIPDKVGFIFTGLPDRSELRPYTLYDWDPAQPGQMTSVHSDLTYPNDIYKENKVMSVRNRKGEIVDYPYYEDESGKKYFITAHLWYKQRDYVLQQTPILAKQDPLGAARLLYRFAQVYEGYVPTNDYMWQNYPLNADSGPPYAYWGGVWYRWYTADLNSLKHLMQAYSEVSKTDAFEVLSGEVGEDVEKKIIEDMFKPSIDYTRSYPVLNHNMEYNNWVGTIELGKALDDPSYIHEAVELVENYSMETYLFDGFFKEVTFSYHNQSIGGVGQAINALEGWSDPADYVSPRSGNRFEQLDMGNRFPVLGKAQELPNLMVYPDGKYFPIMDTWANEKAPAPKYDAGSLLQPASGIARMTRGRGKGVEPEYGLICPFADMRVEEQSVDYRYFANSETIQLEANSPGQRIVFAFEAPAADTYEINLKPFKAGSYGRYDISIDGQTLVDNYNFYSPTSGVHEYEALGMMELTQGTHWISFDNVGKDEASTNYKMGVVKLALLDEAARQARDEGEGREPAEDQSQLYLSFVPKYGHNHYDPLNLVFYGENQELLPDIGYTHTLYRQWTTSTLGHNTVVVDSKDMEKTGKAINGGSIEVFAPVTSGIQVMRARQETAYPQTDEYSREPWMIRFPGQDGGGYILDLFRVAGGNRHEYTLQGDANRDSQFVTDLALDEYGPYLLPPGTEVVEPEGEGDTGSAEGHYYGYIYVRDVSKAELPDGRYELTLETSENGQDQARMKIIGRADPGQNELYIGKSPSLRSTRLNGVGKDINSEAIQYWMPKMVLRREGSHLRSQFVTVMEPYTNERAPIIEGVERLTPDVSADGAVAVEVSYGDYTDLILSSPRSEDSLVIGDITLQGKMGWIRLKNGQVEEMALIGGTLLQKGDVQLTGAGPIAGSVTEVWRQADGAASDGFLLDTEVPDRMKDSYIVITHPDGSSHGYKIKELQRQNGQTFIQTDGIDPGFTIGEDGRSSLKFHPFTSWEGIHTFRIENIATH
ncbi:heparinase II/III family protein [Paenibacillus sp. J2TS4]|uniref:heparinase II/III domain-containing protein n=1 Tax=Paenibacillus sp. J2TS4 TaxID=2807194 RepID=UPI001B1A8FD7|nr:heparinase II/III family protein [Paenibacillus sp. J2TS4]GIP35906.1 hypothetical protein J2TS4_51160 [Paenibacillus sp. J2TS4]